MDSSTKTTARVTPWNKGKLLGQKPPLKLKEIWAIRIRLQLHHRIRELALFKLAIDSKLRGCDLVGLQRRDVFPESDGRITPKIRRIIESVIRRRNDGLSPSCKRDVR